MVAEEEHIVGYRAALSYSSLELEVAQQRVDEAWDIHRRHGLVTGHIPVLEQDERPLWDLAAAHFPDNRPEGYNVGLAVWHDLVLLQSIALGHYQFDRSRKLRIRDYRVPIECAEFEQGFVPIGYVDASHLALAGILTPSVYSTLVSRDYGSMVAEAYPAGRFCRTFGINETTYKRNLAGNGTLFGKFRLAPGKGNQKWIIPRSAAAGVLRDASQGLLVTELVSHLARVYGVSKNTFSCKFYQLDPDKMTPMSDEDPFGAIGFGIYEMLETHGALDLRIVHRVANALARDARIARTHFLKEGVSSRLGASGEKVKQWLKEGKLQGRGIVLLPRGKANGRTVYHCEHDVSQLAVTLFSTREYPPAYVDFCRDHRLNPDEQASLSAYQDAGAVYLREREIDAALRQFLDLHVDGVALSALPLEALLEDGVVAKLSDQNKGLVSGLEAEYAQGASLFPGGELHVPAILRFLPIRGTLDERRAILEDFGMFDTLFAGKPYLSVSELVEFTRVIRLYEHFRACDETQEDIQKGTAVHDTLRIPALAENIAKTNFVSDRFSREVERDLASIVYGDAYVSALIPITGSRSEERITLVELAESYIQDLVSRDPTSALAVSYERMQTVAEMIPIPIKRERAYRAFMLQHLFLEHDLVAQYLTLIADHLQDTSPSPSDIERPAYVLWWQAVQEAKPGARKTQRKKRTKVDGSPIDLEEICFSDRTKAIIDGNRKHVVAAYGGYSSRAHHARQLLVNSMQRASAGVIKEQGWFGLPMDVFMQEAAIGVMRAVEKFEYRQGNRLATLAKWEIRGVMTKALDNYLRLIRIPRTVLETVSKIEKVRRKLGGPEADEYDVSDGEVLDVIDLYVPGLQREQAEAALDRWRSAQCNASMDASRSNHDERDRYEAHEDESVVDAGDSIDSSRLPDEIQQALSTLPEDQAEALRRFYGIGCDAETRVSIAAEDDVTREAIRQREIKALRTLRDNTRLRNFI